ncbi:MAG: type I-B CRISPR-associated protein Cas7/Cst2/DevR [Arcicella sp.]|nr:type I-B CRISPR-associated protein Cas7/Cst2/DevR [Arcicella sp.]
MALSKYQDDLDFGTNFRKKEADKEGGNANIFETEIHSGVYRGTIMIELDRVGKGEDDGFKMEISNAEKKRRILLFIDSLRMLWSAGRQTRFLSDISPKFVAAALMNSKTPVFLESVKVDAKTQTKVDMPLLNSVVNDYKKYIQAHTFAVQDSIFEKQEGMVSLADGFAEIEKWVEGYYKD